MQPVTASIAFASDRFYSGAFLIGALVLRRSLNDPQLELASRGGDVEVP
jgi:hypothetical protein